MCRISFGAQRLFLRALELTQAAWRRDRLAKGGKRAGELQGGLRVLHPGD